MLFTTALLKIRINTVPIRNSNQTGNNGVCHFRLLSNYLTVRGKYAQDNEPLFIFCDGSPVTPNNYCLLLKKLLCFNRLNPRLYCIHGIRVGHAGDLLDAGVLVETIKQIGRWKLNAVYLYLKH